MQKLSGFIVKHAKIILFAALVLTIPALLGMARTRTNYDMLSYLPQDIDTVRGAALLEEEFGRGAFSFVIFENVPETDVELAKQKIERVDGVASVIWYSSVFDLSTPMDFLPAEIYDAFNTENSTMMAVFFDSGTSEDRTLAALGEIRSIVSSQALVSGMTALVTDLRDLSQSERLGYIILAVVLVLVAMEIFLDNYLIPLVFLASIGIMVLFNMGSNIIFGEISFITEALASVLQLAVTMDYSIFLWHRYHEELETEPDSKKAMARAISATFSSVVGSSITTVAGFVALCFMTFAIGLDLGLVMAKGVVFGVLGCVTVLPALILVLDPLLARCHHRPLLPSMAKFSALVLNSRALIALVFLALIAPAYLAYTRTNSEVYYSMGSSLPERMPYVQAEKKLTEDFGMESTHMLLLSSFVSESDVRALISSINSVPGVRYTLALESVLGERIPAEVLPSSLTAKLKGDNYQLLLVGSEYGVASDAVSTQLDSIYALTKACDPGSLLIGEAPATKDLIQTTATDFAVVNIISIVAIFFIIAIVERSLSLPFILIAVIELAIFINLGLCSLTGQSLNFIAPICISTIQLGATVDYAILMTTRYKTERIMGATKKPAILTALSTSIPSIIVSSMGFFLATLGVSLVSGMDMIRSICMLMSRGALISMALVILVLPSLLYIFDKIICKTTKEMTHVKN